jgi:hypothetical protein
LKRIKAFVVAVFLSVISLVVFLHFYIPYLDNYYKVSDNSVRYSISPEKYKSTDIIKSNLDQNTLVLFGSSELAITNHKEYSFNKVFNTKDFHIMQLGSGSDQNIIHASLLGSLGDAVPKKRIAIVESMQWFEEKDQNRKAFEGRISKEAVYNALNNEALTQETKTKLINRIITLSSDNQSLKETFERYKRVLVDKSPIGLDEWLIKVDLLRYNYILKNKFANDKKSLGTKKVNSELASEINWEQRTSDAVKDAEKKTKNNPFGMDDDAFNMNYSKRVESAKDSKKDINLLDSEEYEDFKLFLEIAKELGIEAKIILFPVNGKWYDHIGINKESRKKYYEKIKAIAKEYGATVWDISDKEYESYYMHDGIHPGWKSWLETNKALYEYFSK